MGRRIAVVAAEAAQQAEALRVCVGISALNDDVGLFLLDHELKLTPDISGSMEMIREIGNPVFTNTVGNNAYELLTNARIADKLLEYDHVLVF